LRARFRIFHCHFPRDLGLLFLSLHKIEVKAIADFYFLLV
jgi:hypothetical protein